MSFASTLLKIAKKLTPAFKYVATAILTDALMDGVTEKFFSPTHKANDIDRMLVTATKGMNPLSYDAYVRCFSYLTNLSTYMTADEYTLFSLFLKLSIDFNGAPSNARLHSYNHATQIDGYKKNEVNSKWVDRLKIVSLQPFVNFSLTTPPLFGTLLTGELNRSLDLGVPFLRNDPIISILLNDKPSTGDEAEIMAWSLLFATRLIFAIPAAKSILEASAVLLKLSTKAGPTNFAFAEWKGEIDLSSCAVPELLSLHKYLFISIRTAVTLICDILYTDVYAPDQTYVQLDDSPYLDYYQTLNGMQDSSRFFRIFMSILQDNLNPPYFVWSALINYCKQVETMVDRMTLPSPDIWPKSISSILLFTMSYIPDYYSHQ